MASLLPGSQVTHLSLVLQFFRSVSLLCLLHTPDNHVPSLSPPCFVPLLSSCAHYSQYKHQPPFIIMSIAPSMLQAPFLESCVCVCTHMCALIWPSLSSGMVLVSSLLYRVGRRHGRWGENHLPDITRLISDRGRNLCFCPSTHKSCLCFCVSFSGSSSSRPTLEQQAYVFVLQVSVLGPVAHPL